MSKKTEEEVSTNNNQNILYIIIMILLVIIAIGAFFIGMKLGQNNTPTAPSLNTQGEEAIASDITVTVYDDTRCNDCETDTILEQLKLAPILTNATYVLKDFSDDGVSDFLKENGISKLPAVLFSTNAVGSNLAQYLTPLPSGDYSLSLGASYDPFIERSARGFLVADSELLQELKETAYIKGPEDAEISWIEYTDVNCGYCKKMETDGTAEKVLANFPTQLNKSTSHFIGVGGAATQKAAELLECVGKNGGADVFNSMLSRVLAEGKNDEDSILTMAVENGLDKTVIKSCLDNGEMKETVARKFDTGTQEFGITGTPGNVLINTKTGEYEIVSGAYPSEKFIETVNLLLEKS